MVAANRDEASSEPLSLEAKAVKCLRQEVEANCRGIPLAEAAPRCECVRNMILLQCLSLSRPSSKATIKELWDAEAAAEQITGLAVLESIKEMARRLMWSVQDERAPPSVEVHVRSNAAIHKQHSEMLCDQLLVPALGEKRAWRVWNTCHNGAWHVQNSKQRYHNEAKKDLLWMEHHAHRMGFDEDVAPVPVSRAMAALCYRLCNEWTSVNATDGATGQEETGLREAAREIALIEAREVLPPMVTQTVQEGLLELRKSTFQERLADRKAPGKLLANLIAGYKGQARAASMSAWNRLYEQLVPKLGVKQAEKVWQTCHSAAWLEQNLYDYESALAGRLTGARVGYLNDARGNWADLLKSSVHLNFNGLPSTGGGGR